MPQVDRRNELRSDRVIKIATFAVPLSGNKGSVSMLHGLLDALTHDGYEVDALVYSYYPRRDSHLAATLRGVKVRAGHPLDLALLIPLLVLNRLFGFILPSGLRRAFRELRERDVICLVGGTTFADSMLHKVPWNLMAGLPALLVGRPFVLLSQTIGPFQRLPNRLAARWLLSRAAGIHGRGHRSVENVKSLGISVARYWPDLSFGMELEKARHSPRLKFWGEQLDALGADAADRLVGITPNTIVEAKMQRVGIDYPALLAAVVIDLDARGYRPVLIPHSFRSESQSGHNNDGPLCRRVLSLLPGGVRCLYLEEDLTSQELRLLVSRFRFLVASRFHSMISALATGVPPITIGWGDHKYIEVLEAFRVPELYLDYSEAELNAVRSKIDWLEKYRAAVIAHIEAGLAETAKLNAGLGVELMSVSGK
jgi:polysaccharide pyruvyl transferase WcaK-like protein